MKKVLLGISLLILTICGMSVSAQNILTAEDETNLSNYYQRTMSTTKQALPYPFLRESDVVWETCVWRTVDFREKFNQFFYFPKGEDSLNNNQGRINLAYLIYRNAANGEFEIFDDDELKVPVEWEYMYRKLNKADTTLTDLELERKDIAVRQLELDLEKTGEKLNLELAVKCYLLNHLEETAPEEYSL